jgi:hypothetical protein
MVWRLMRVPLGCVLKLPAGGQRVPAGGQVRADRGDGVGFYVWPSGSGLGDWNVLQVHQS